MFRESDLAVVARARSIRSQSDWHCTCSYIGAASIIKPILELKFGVGELSFSLYSIGVLPWTAEWRNMGKGKNNNVAAPGSGNPNHGPQEVR